MLNDGEILLRAILHHGDSIWTLLLLVTVMIQVAQRVKADLTVNGNTT